MICIYAYLGLATSRTHRLVAEMLDTAAQICGFAHEGCYVPWHCQIEIRLIPFVAMRIM